MAAGGSAAKTRRTVRLAAPRPAAIMIGMIATWSTALSTATAKAWGAAMGLEFFRKGVNVQPGPCCTRATERNGRNFEHLSSGPGAKLRPHSVVRASHFGHPEPEWHRQCKALRCMADAHTHAHTMCRCRRRCRHRPRELTPARAAPAHSCPHTSQLTTTRTNRGRMASNVDERTELEIHCPPLEAAARARAGSIMCSHNKVELGNGTSFYSCENLTRCCATSSSGWASRAG